MIRERGTYIRNSVFAASDGLITTFAVVAGSQGAGLGPTVVVIMGFANLFADGVSMSSGTYMGVKSENEFEEKQGERQKNGATPIKQALVSFSSFAVAGLIPLLPFLFGLQNAFLISSIFVLCGQFTIGSLGGKLSGKHWLKKGAENMLIGGGAAMAAYITGNVVKMIVTR